MTDVESIEEGFRAIGRLMAEGFLEELEARQPLMQIGTSPDAEKPQTTGRSEEYMDTEQLADLLSLPPASVQRLARDGRLPFYRVGRLMRFDVDEVMAALKAPA